MPSKATSSIQKTALLLLTLLSVESLAGCGKKPRIVDTPDARSADTFPRTYPAPQKSAD